jgi:hypothetical protein
MPDLPIPTILDHEPPPFADTGGDRRDTVVFSVQPHELK